MNAKEARLFAKENAEKNVKEAIEGAAKYGRLNLVYKVNEDERSFVEDYLIEAGFSVVRGQDYCHDNDELHISW